MKTQAIEAGESMDTNARERKIRGKIIKVPSTRIGDQTVMVSGKWIKMATLRGEDWSEGPDVPDPVPLLAKIREKGLKADIFAFSQKLPEIRPKYDYPMEWDNVAAIPITSYQEWWEKRLPQVTRKSVRRGYKRGVVARVAEFDDQFVKGIVGIHNETLMKQGEPFAHYGKDFGVVKQEYGTYPERSEFLGAYYGSELIGIIKLVYMGKMASIMQILSKEAHYDKRPTNILIAKAVEICEKKGLSFLIYGKYVYGNKSGSPLTEFKRRTGFEQINIPRYYIPLNAKGRMIIKLKLHRGLLGILPGWAISFLLGARSRYYQMKLRPWKRVAGAQGQGQGKRTSEGEGREDP